MLKFPGRKNKSENGFDVGSQSDVGMIRTENQDSFGVFTYESPNGSPEHLFVVADGMGGHERGSEASTMAVKTLGENFVGDPEEDPIVRLQRLFDLANDRIFAHSQQIDKEMSMGTTCTVVAVSQNRFWIGHVGDSRAYRIGKDAMTQLTEDHTLINELLREGILTEEEANNDPRKHSLIQAMGVGTEMRPDVFEIPRPEKGERILICSDGLAVVSEEKIAQVVRDKDAQSACDELVNMANRQGGPDNTTVVVFGLS